VGSAWDGVVKMEGEEIPEIAERGGSSIRSREWCLEALSYSELLHHIGGEKDGIEHGYCTYVGLSVLCLLTTAWLEVKAVRAHSSLCWAHFVSASRSSLPRRTQVSQFSHSLRSVSTFKTGF